MDTHTLLLALGLAFVIEALLPFTTPRTWRQAMRQASELSDGQIRFLALLGLLAGLGLMWLA